MSKLNMWNRLGIVLTVLWLASAPLVLVERDTSRWLEAMNLGRKYCMDAVERGPVDKYESGMKSCWDRWVTNVDIHSGPTYWQYAGICLAGAFLVWILAYAVACTARWIWAGATRTSAKYSDHVDYLIASIIYLATQRGWWARTPKMLASELSLDEAKLAAVFDGFPGIFRKSAQPSEIGQHYYSLQARYALLDDHNQEEDRADTPTLPIETTRLIYDFVLKAADDERTRQRTWNSNRIAVGAAIASAITAIIVAFLKG
jgi:hypothetical protein